MNPLESVIGLSPIDSGDGRLYVNRVMNVNPQLLEAIAEVDDLTEDSPDGIEQIWQEVKDEAYDQLKSCLLSEFAKRANFQEVVEMSHLPSVDGSETIDFDDEMLVGVNVTMPKSRYQSLFIRNLYVHYDADVAPENLIIKIFDADKAVQIGSDITVPFVAGLNDYSVNVSVDCSKAGNKSVFVAVQVPAGVTLHSIDWNADCSYSINSFLAFDPADMPFLSDPDDLDSCFVALEYDIRLSVDKVIAQFADRLRRAYGLMCAIGIIDRGLKSKKASKWSLVNRDSEKDAIVEMKEDLKKELAGACRQIYGQLENEKLALVSKPDDQQGYFIGSMV